MRIDPQSGWGVALSDQADALLTAAAARGWPTTVVKFGAIVSGQQAWQDLARHGSILDVRLAADALGVRRGARA
jgi:hypothetical protein